jgi:hypothetical protein
MSADRCEPVTDLEVCAPPTTPNLAQRQMEREVEEERWDAHTPPAR